MNTNQKGGMAASYASGGQYGFSDKVVDGITLTVNSVLLTLKSCAFIASFQVSLLLVYFWLCRNRKQEVFPTMYVIAAVVRCAQILYTENRQYGCSDKVVDGIALTANSVLLTLKCRAFIASFQVSLFLVQEEEVGSITM